MLQVHLKAILNVRKISIREFSKRINYRFETVRKFHNGELERIPVELLKRACRELNCDISDLITFVAEGSDESAEESK